MTRLRKLGWLCSGLAAAVTISSALGMAATANVFQMFAYLALTLIGGAVAIWIQIDMRRYP